MLSCLKKIALAVATWTKAAQLKKGTFSRLTFKNTIQERNKQLTYTMDFFKEFTQALHDGCFLWSD